MNDWNDAEQRVERAEELFEQRKWSEALRELRAAVSINPYNSAWFYNMGLTLDAMERYEEAVEAYRQALAIDEDDVETLERLGSDQIELEQFKAALESFEKIGRISPDRESSYCHRIHIYAELGEHDKAEEMFYLARLYKDQCPQCLYHIGCSLLARRRYDQAIDCWRRSLDLDADNPQAHLRMAEAYWEQGRQSEARRHYLSALRQDPGDVDILLDLGDLLMEMDRPDEADEKYRRAIELAPDEPGGYFSHGCWLVRQGHPRPARACFRRALRLDPTWPEAHLRLGVLQLQRGRMDRALRHFRAEWRMNPDDPRVLAELGRGLMDLRQWVLADKVLTRLLEVEPDHADGLLNFAVAAFQLDRADDGIKACRKLLRRDPGNRIALFNVALAYERRGEYVRALRWIQRGLRTDPRDGDLLKLRFRVRVMRLGTQLRRLVGFRSARREYH